MLIAQSAESQVGNFKIRNDGFIQLGYSTYNTLSIGGHNTPAVNGEWAFEHWNGGLNLWRPWPAGNAANYRLFVKDLDGYVGIGKYPSYKLDVNGDIATYGTFRIASDASLKTDIQPLGAAQCLAYIKQINTYTYRYKSTEQPVSVELNPEDSEIKTKTILSQSKREAEEVPSELRYGFMADELKEINPDLVSENEEGVYAIDFAALTPILLGAVKDLNN